ncbi:PhoU domain-containing protein [Candidatus Mycobacterium methanotrophicum]|uniref:Phosphate transport system regulatory protein PhoU n=1 Tax=Candidatus Mycobacterium methanotrophicum TaxID=2943498 RepID=A0ABY4QIG5_9MYCO|nr:PhoU domain-containing protein [Candidatus Mycobacterium methanotrophicum]UQX10292.1 phosphate transport system regulatory protein PhoU [Candidatus Mycobacterium methanotrophicum]
MESAFRYQFGALTAQLAEMCAMAAQAMNDATYALLDADRSIADAVIAGYDETAAMSSSAHETTYLLLSMPAPVATNLSAVVDAVQIAVDAERMGELATQVARIACRRHPDRAVPTQVVKPIADMGALAVSLAGDARDTLLSGDSALAAHISRGRDAMENLHRELVTLLVDERWAHGVAVAVDVTLLGGCYQRFADHTVQIARRVAFLTAGRYGRTQPATKGRPVSPLPKRSA